jgi:hypothetical protein
MDDERKPSWLDEVSLPTKFVVVATVLSIVGFALVRLFELFF